MRRNPLTWRQVPPTQQANTTGALKQFTDSTGEVFNSLKDAYDQQRAVNTANMLNDLISGKPIRNIKSGNFDSNALNDASMSLERSKLKDEDIRAKIEKAKADTEFKLAQALQQQTQNEYLPQSLKDTEKINKTKVSMAEYTDKNKGRVLDSALNNEASRTRLNNFKSNPFNSLAETKIPASVINANNKAQTALTEELTKSYRNKEIPIKQKMSTKDRIKYGIDKGIIDDEDTYLKNIRKNIKTNYKEMLDKVPTRKIEGITIDKKSTNKYQQILQEQEEDLAKVTSRGKELYNNYLKIQLSNKKTNEDFSESDKFEIPIYIKGTRKLTNAEILKKVNPNGLYEMIGALTGINANKDENIKDKVKDLTKRLEKIKDSKKRIRSQKTLVDKLNALTDDNNEVSKQKIIDFLDNFENSITE